MRTDDASLPLPGACRRRKEGRQRLSAVGSCTRVRSLLSGVVGMHARTPGKGRGGDTLRLRGVHCIDATSASTLCDGWFLGSLAPSLVRGRILQPAGAGGGRGRPRGWQSQRVGRAPACAPSTNVWRCSWPGERSVVAPCLAVVDRSSPRLLLNRALRSYRIPKGFGRKCDRI